VPRLRIAAEPGRTQLTVGSSIITFAESARNKQQISRAGVEASGLVDSNSMVLLDESGPVGFASRSLLKILQRISSETSAADWCRPTVQRARLRRLRLCF